MLEIKNLLKLFFIPVKKNGYLPRILRSRPLFWYGVAILGLKIAVIFLILFLPATSFFSAISSQQLLTLINEARSEGNLKPLTLNPQLTTAADRKAADMIVNDYFEHTSPQGVTPWDWFKIVGYSFVLAGENLAMDFFESDAVFQAWMDSPSHRANILNPNFREIGIAVKEGKMANHQTTLAILTLGTPAPTKKAIATSPSPTPASPTPVKTVAPTAVPKAMPTATPEASLIISGARSSLSPSPTETETALKTALGTFPPAEISPFPQITLVDISAIIDSPRILGAFTSKIDEITKSLYLYATLFLIAALAVNIFVKIRIQHWATIITTSGLIVASVILIFI